MDARTDDTAGKCPFPGARGHRNRGLVRALDIEMLLGTRAIRSDGPRIRLRQGVQDSRPRCRREGPARLMTDSRSVSGRLRALWWLFIRWAWHAAGTYRITDGRGGAGAGQQRFAPLTPGRTTRTSTSTPAVVADQAKVRRKLSWADLMVLVGNVCPGVYGLQDLRFAGVRADVWEPERLFWGPEGTCLGRRNATA